MVKIQVPDGFHPDLSPHFPPGWSRFGSNLLKILASIFEAVGHPLIPTHYVLTSFAMAPCKSRDTRSHKRIEYVSVEDEGERGGLDFR